MKIKLILLAAVAVTLFSCSSDDDSGNNGNGFTVPLETGKYWTYDVTGSAGGRDSLYISGDTLINSISYKKFKTRENPATGFYSTSLKNNGVRYTNDKLLMSGEFGLAGLGGQLPINIDLTLSDLVIFDENATPNIELSRKSGQIIETIQGYPLTIDYALRSVSGEAIANFVSPNGDIYSSVKTSKMILSLKVTTIQTIGGIQIPLTVLNQQDVMTSTQYIANGIGMVYANNVTTYSLNPTIASQLGIPATDTQTQEEFLDTHN